jgi:hypothetical protein
MRPRIQLVTDVSKWGLLKWPAQTRGRLAGTAIAATILAFVGGFAAAHYVLELSTSVLLNLLVITAAMMLVIIAGFLQAVLAADLFFPGAWREHVFLGNKPHNDKLDLSAVDDHSAEFIILIVILVALNAVALNLGTGGFLDTYHNEGFFQVRMRSANPNERVAALEKLAEPNSYRLWERSAIKSLIIDAFDDPHPDVRSQAIWNAGALELPAARSRLRDILNDVTATDPVRGQAAIALGKLGEDAEARQPMEAIVTSDAGQQLRIDALRGLGLMASNRAIPTLAATLDDPDPDVMAYAFWAIGRSGRNQAPARDAVRAILDAHSFDATTIDRRTCAALDAFKMVASDDDTTWARRQFQRVPAELRCPGLIWEERDGRPQQILWEEPVRLKLLKTVANTNPFDNRDWIQRLVNDPNEDWYLREVADEILRQMNRAGR